MLMTRPQLKINGAVERRCGGYSSDSHGPHAALLRPKRSLTNPQTSPPIAAPLDEIWAAHQVFGNRAVNAPFFIGNACCQAPYHTAI